MDTIKTEYENAAVVDYVEHNQELELTGPPIEVEPNDFWYRTSYPYNDHTACYTDTTHQRQWYLTRTNYQRAWGISTGDSSVVIAILDTGLDYNHHDLIDRIQWNQVELNAWIANPDSIADADGNGYDNDIFGWDFGNNDNDPIHDPPGSPGNGDDQHGTAMAGIFAASTNNEPTSGSPAGVAAATWAPKVLPMKIFGSEVYYVDAAISAINYLLDYKTRHNVRISVINMSWRCYPNSSLEALLTLANGAGILPVGGAGNNNSEYVWHPAKYSDVLAAACVDSFGAKIGGSDGSSYGVEVDVCGFGSRIREPGGNWDHPPQPGLAIQLQCLAYDYSDPAGWSFCESNEPHIIGFTDMRTSGATAQASGLAALVMSVYPNLNTAQVREMIRRGAINVDSLNPSYAGKLGSGRMDAYRTLSLWGTVASDTTLSGEVWVSGDVIVDPGVTLTFAAGTVVHVAPDDNEPASGYDSALCALVIKGGLAINGTASNPVTISGWSDGPEEGDWKGIIVDQNAGNINIEHLILKHAEIGVFTDGVDIDVAHCEFDSCGTGIFIEEAGGTIHNVLAQNCGDKGFYVLGASGSFASAEFDSCRANSNNYGFYFDDYTNSCTISNKCEADNNVINGILCRSSMTIGPKVSMDNNGQDGLRLMYAGSSGVVQGVKAINHSSGAGLRCNFSSSPEIKDCYFSDNYDNVATKYTSYPILGDVANSKGKNNSILTATRYDVGNFNKNWTMMAENCYWGPTGGGSMPALSISGSVDISPWLTSDPGFSWRLPQGGFARNSWVSENYPNPFNPETRIKYFVANSGDKVTIQIYDISGKLVKELANEQKAAGLHSIIWNGRNNTGEGVASGVYFARVKVGSDLDETKKLMLVK